MCDDVFLRSAPKLELINKMEEAIKGNVAAVNFELTYDGKDVAFNDVFLKRSSNAAYKTSLMCQM